MTKGKHDHGVRNAIVCACGEDSFIRVGESHGIKVFVFSRKLQEDDNVWHENESAGSDRRNDHRDSPEEGFFMIGEVRRMEGKGQILILDVKGARRETADRDSEDVIINNITERVAGTGRLGKGCSEHGKIRKIGAKSQMQESKRG